MKNEVKEIEKINWITETGAKDENVMCQYLTYIPPQKYNWTMENIDNLNFANIFVSKAEAQSFSSITSASNSLSTPLYIIVFFFLLFTVTMSGVYIYHWVKFNLNDPFIKNFILIYFAGLCALLLPLLIMLLS